MTFARGSLNPDARHRGHKGHEDKEISMARLSLTDAEQRIKGLNGWTLQGDAIRKQYTFRDFLEAIKFVNCLAPKAEAADHHPDILINYKRVTLTYSTHSEGGLTTKDFEGAAMAEQCV
jgi:4a-hydroxytetrahydrobiopterin dehydratase